MGLTRFVVSTIDFALPRPAASPNRACDRHVIDRQGRTTAVHEEVH
jgi:hypothetical protein